MSNPAVITLDNASSSLGKFKRFVIEDNIGESIHIHIDNMRIDFTIEEFLRFAELIRNSLHELDLLDGHRVDSFDEHFLKESSTCLPRLKGIRMDEVELSQLRFVVFSHPVPSLSFAKLRPVTKIPAYKYLQGDKNDFLQYKQTSYFGLDNETRLLSLVESIKKFGYPDSDRHLILFDNQNIVRDGQHRAAILAHIHGPNYKVKVMRFDFGKKRCLVRVYVRNIKTLLFWTARRIYKACKR